MEKITAKIVMGHYIAHMYCNENRPGTCPICHNTVEKIPDSLYKVSKKRGIFFIPMTAFVLFLKNLKDFVMKEDTRI